MGLSKFEISLENTSGVFFPGSQVRGVLYVHIDESPKTCRGIKICMIGGAYVRFTETEHHTVGNKRETKHVTYTNQEIYADNMKYVFGTGRDKLDLAPGEYAYPFTFSVPPNAPSSFEGVHGRVRYAIRAIIDRPWKFDHNLYQFFTVICPLDLNLDPLVALGVNDGTAKDLGCLCCKAGSIQAQVKLPKTGFVPGESIPFTAEISNHSSREVKSSCVKLIVEVNFIARKTRQAYGLISKHKKEDVIPPGETGSWDNYLIPVPPLPPSQLQNCRIIDINYFLLFEVTPSGLSFDLRLRTPITIGSVPLRSAFAAMAPDAANANAAADNPFMQAYNAATVGYENLQNPDTEASAPPAQQQQQQQQGGLTEEDGGGGGAFQPKYMTYNFANVPPPGYQPPQQVQGGPEKQ